MALQVDWQGVYPAVPTQFNEDFSLDIKGTQKHVEALLSEGIHGLVMLGTIGENCSLSLDAVSYTHLTLPTNGTV